ncbi:MAG: lamin tail domain-containing protein [Candidatus Pacebacteria bacterium]|nr:lamin tail domain-containing protein [Candidatus Paceibacterota bacterium]
MRKFSSCTIAFLLTLLFSHNFVFALADLPVSITEIMYDLKGGSDTGREWVEIQNRGDVSISLSGFRLLDSTKEVLENHEPLKPIQGGSTIPAHGYAVIASDSKKFLADNPGFSGILFSSSFSLSNTGEILVLKDKVGNEIDRILYMPSWGGAGDGNSIQSFSDGWRAGAPSPGGAEKILPPTPAPLVVAKSITTPRPFSVAPSPEKNTSGSQVSTPSIDSSLASLQSSGVVERPSSLKWILGFIGFLVLVIVAFLFVSKNKNPIDEIKIIE